MNPTTASTLAAYRDELEGANFADDMVAHLVMDAARELVANEGLTVKASELEFPGMFSKASRRIRQIIV